MGLMGNGIETGSGRVLWYSSVPGLEDLIFTEPIVRHRLILLTPLSLSLSLSLITSITMMLDWLIGSISSHLTD